MGQIGPGPFFAKFFCIVFFSDYRPSFFVGLAPVARRFF